MPGAHAILGSNPSGPTNSYIPIHRQNHARPRLLSSVQMQLSEWANITLSRPDSNNQTSSHLDTNLLPLVAVVTVSVSVVVLVGAGLLIYFKKRNNKAEITNH